MSNDSPNKVAHDVETVEVEGSSNIYLTASAAYMGHGFVLVGIYPLLIAVKSLVTKGWTPGPPPFIMYDAAASGLH